MGDAAPLLLSSPSHSILVFVLVVLLVPRALLCEGDDYVHYTECCRSFSCGTVQNLTYPFWGGGRPQFCGLEGFKVECYEEQHPILEYQAQKYRVLKIDQHLRTMTIARMDLMDGTCLRVFWNTSTMESTLFNMTPAVGSLSIFYGCLGTLKNISNEFECFYNVSRKSAFYMEDVFLNRKLPFDVTCCLTSIKVPVLHNTLDDLGRGNISLLEALNRGFDVQYSDQPECSACTSSGGFCGSNSSSPSSSFTCYCRDKPYARTCNHPGTFFR
ncbi:LEAF RUST 10 DISEASE-RESISTANCE LOCUS RECEPTOR-LIKE PROTEIN KINASE-like 2.7 [Syzygium oleosum]|uniref:LEAF RUST 10 DISEASE-RESISTANCE LOCUS RECEPTOR-LIKE PROTEIN KINASE-like 2.7 n=1 Tax=Syzygium oleosum TaxID=219896 RepID=UPI0024B9F7C0|nr:LEAF RUST 10 DISEASE-RESISTANCE LOCUS RECEPTOR-LIKE PROTEIN KINASE-like 2.7 [Syzygium oleosum]